MNKERFTAILSELGDVTLTTAEEDKEEYRHKILKMVEYQLKQASGVSLLCERDISSNNLTIKLSFSY